MGAECEDRRADFLIHMYDQMFNDINTHILVVWQSIAVVVGAFAVFGLVEKQIISLDIAVAIVTLLCAWLFAHLYDASYWYNRNLVIIANIERQFLHKEDLTNIHYYFGKHRKTSSMLTHLRIQWYLGFLLVVLVLGLHLVLRVIPGLGAPWRTLEPQRLLPYCVAGICVWLLIRLRKNRIDSYAEFVKNSPGINVDASRIIYGVGHPTDPAPSSTAPTVAAEKSTKS